MTGMNASYGVGGGGSAAAAAAAAAENGAMVTN
jgi:hypothetical protein